MTANRYNRQISLGDRARWKTINEQGQEYQFGVVTKIKQSKRNKSTVEIKLAASWPDLVKSKMTSKTVEIVSSQLSTWHV